jgi:hypothetical protein
MSPHHFAQHPNPRQAEVYAKFEKMYRPSVIGAKEVSVAGHGHIMLPGQLGGQSIK